MTSMSSVTAVNSAPSVPLLGSEFFSVVAPRRSSAFCQIPPCLPPGAAEAVGCWPRREIDAGRWLLLAASTSGCTIISGRSGAVVSVGVFGGSTSCEFGTIHAQLRHNNVHSWCGYRRIPLHILAHSIISYQNTYKSLLKKRTIF